MAVSRSPSDKAVTIFWPPSISQAIAAGSWQETPEANVAAFATEVGTPKMRRRSSVASRLITFKTLPLTSDQWDDLLDWYKIDLVDGTQPFMRQNGRTKELETYTFVSDTPPQANDIGGLYFQASLSLRKEP